MPKRMWFNNPRYKEIKRDKIEVDKILNGYEHIDRNIFFSSKKDSRTKGQEVTLVRDQCIPEILTEDIK